jgi:O-antigen/teichoic acid export membrane protein
MSESKPGIASRLASQSGLVMLGNIFTLLVGFPFQIYLARKLGVNQLGALGLLEVVAQTLGAIFSFGLGFSLVRFIPQYAGQGQNRHVTSLLVMVFTVTVCAGIAAATLVMIGYPTLLHWMPELYPYAELLPLTAFMTLLGMLIAISQQALRAFFDIRHMILMSSFVQLVIKVVMAIFLLWLGWELMGYMIAVVVSSVVALTGMLWWIYINMKRLDRTAEVIAPESRKLWVSYSRVMYGTYMLGVIGPFAERLLLVGLIDLASVGVLLVIRQLYILLQVPLTIITTGVAPMFASAKANGDMEEVKHIYHIATDWGCRLGFPLVIFLLFFGGEVLAIYGDTFSTAGQLPLMLLVMGQTLNLLAGPAGTMLDMVGYEKKVFRFNVISNAIGFGFMLLLVPYFGLVGMAIGTIFSMLCFNMAVLLTMKMQIAISWWTVRYARMVTPVAVLVLFLALVKSYGNVAGSWLLAVLLLSGYGVFFGVYACLGFTSEDREIFALFKGKCDIGPQKGNP